MARLDIRRLNSDDLFEAQEDFMKELADLFPSTTSPVNDDSRSEHMSLTSTDSLPSPDIAPFTSASSANNIAHAPLAAPHADLLDAMAGMPTAPSGPLTLPVVQTAVAAPLATGGVSVTTAASAAALPTMAPVMDLQQALLQARQQGIADASNLASSGAMWGSRFAEVNFAGALHTDPSNGMISAFGPASYLPQYVYASTGQGQAPPPPGKEEQPVSRFKRSRLKAKANMQALERELEEKLAAVQLLSATNEDLRTRSEVLEKAITVRDKQLAIWRVVGPPAIHEEERPPSNGPQGGAAAPPCGVSPGSEAPQGAADAAAAAPSTSGGGQGGHTGCPMGGALPRRPPNPSDAQEFDSAVRSMPQFLRCLKFMPLTEVVTRWRQFVGKASELLLQLDTRPGDEALVTELHGVVSTMGFCCLNVASLNPTLMLRFTTFDMEEGRVVNTWGQNMDSHWERVLDLMRLTEGQERQMVHVFSLMGRELLKVTRAREALQADLDAMLSKGAGEVDTSQKQAAFVRQLAANYRREYGAFFLLNATVFDQVVDPMQMARMVVHSFPYWPNVCSMAIILCRRRGVSTVPTLGDPAVAQEAAAAAAATHAAVEAASAAAAAAAAAAGAPPQYWQAGVVN